MKREKRKSGSLIPPSRGLSPFRQLNRLHDEIERFFEGPFWGLSAAATPFQEGWSPVVDVYQDKYNVVVKAELPGMKKEDLNVFASDDTLNISGERKEESEHETAESYSTERYFGRFQRRIGLPASVQGDKIHAEYKDGVLTITAPKTEEAKRKQIEIKVD